MTLRRATLLFGVAAACGGDSSPSNTPTTPTPAAVSSIVVSPATPNIPVGGMIQLSATTLDAAGKTLSGRAVTWASSAASVANVSSSGSVTGLAAGSATITASSEGKAGSAALTVTAPSVTQISVTPTASTIFATLTIQLVATTRDAAGNTAPGHVITWSSSDLGVATVSASGLVTGVAAGTATLTAASEGISAQATVTTLGVVATGINDIQSFLEKCPTNDAAFATLRQDFEVRVDGGPPTAVPACTEPISTLPIDQLTDELIAWQILRTAFYMSHGTEGKLPWTTKSLYDWMKSHISGVNIKTAPGQLYCCDVINGKFYFSTSRQDAVQRDFKRPWQGISNSLNFYAHEIRHADPGSLGHTNGCQTFPLPTDPLGCDARYDLGNLGGYGVQFWLESSWALGLLNIGIGCAPSTVAQTYAKWDEQSANSFRGRFVTSIPPAVVAPTPFGGPCLR